MPWPQPLANIVLKWSRGVERWCCWYLVVPSPCSVQRASDGADEKQLSATVSTSGEDDRRQQVNFLPLVSVRLLLVCACTNWAGHNEQVDNSHICTDMLSDQVSR